MLTYSLLVPHPPAIIPAIGGADALKFQQTINALISLSLRLKTHRPDTLVIISPHAEIEPDRFSIRVPKVPKFTADFSEFVPPEKAALVANLRREYARDRILTAQIIESVSGTGMRITPTDSDELDYGASVPLFYLAASLPDVALVSLGVSLAGAHDHFRLGKIIRELADESGKKIVFVASGELSHKLTKNSPHGFAPRARTWDEHLIADLKNGDAEKILNADPFERDEVGECGYRSIATLLGTVAELVIDHKITSYEAPAGIGCAVGWWERQSA